MLSSVIILALLISILLYYCYKQQQQIKEQSTQCIEYQTENAKLQERCNILHKVQEQYDESLQKNVELEKKVADLSAKLEQEKILSVEKNELFKQTEEAMSNKFKVISAELMDNNTQNFLHLAKTTLSNLHQETQNNMEHNAKNVQAIINPLNDTLSKLGDKLASIEKDRAGSYGALHQRIDDLIKSENLLKQETTNLAAALKSPNTRGRWGEIHLHRVVELSGMSEHCDFEEQVTIEKDGRSIRPDMIIYFPEGKRVVVDAKTPIDSYLHSFETHNLNEKAKCMEDHAKHLVSHIDKLGSKDYWTYFQPSPEFVIMFLPCDAFLSVALEYKPSIMEDAFSKRVVIATPTTLLALLRTIALGWRHVQISEQANEILETGKRLYSKLAITSQHLDKLRRSLSSSVDCYNQIVGNMESGVFSTIRKFQNLEKSKTIHTVQTIDNNARQIQKMEAEIGIEPV